MAEVMRTLGEIAIRTALLGGIVGGVPLIIGALTVYARVTTVVFERVLDLGPDASGPLGVIAAVATAALCLYALARGLEA